MPATAITPVKLKLNIASVYPTLQAVDPTDGAAINMAGVADQKCLIILQNGTTGTKTATIVAGNAIQGVGDLAVSLSDNQIKCIRVDSGRFQNATGANKGKIIVKGTDNNVKVGCVVLP